MIQGVGVAGIQAYTNFQTETKTIQPSATQKADNQTLNTEGSVQKQNQFDSASTQTSLQTESDSVEISGTQDVPLTYNAKGTPSVSFDETELQTTSHFPYAPEDEKDS